MGFLDKLKKQAGDAVDKHGDQIAKGIDKAAGLADAKTKGKHGDQIAKGAAAAKNALDKLDGKNDDIPDEQPPRLRAHPDLRRDRQPGRHEVTDAVRSRRVPQVSGQRRRSRRPGPGRAGEHLPGARPATSSSPAKTGSRS